MNVMSVLRIRYKIYLSRKEMVTSLQIAYFEVCFVLIFGNQYELGLRRKKGFQKFKCKLDRHKRPFRKFRIHNRITIKAGQQGRLRGVTDAVTSRQNAGLVILGCTYKAFRYSSGSKWCSIGV